MDDEWMWIGIIANYSRNVPSFPVFTHIATSTRLIALPPVPGYPGWRKVPRPTTLPGDFLVSAPNFSGDILNTQYTRSVMAPVACGLSQGFAVGFLPGLWHWWPYELSYSDLLPGVHGRGDPLDDGDVINVVREVGVLPGSVVEISLRSDLYWFKRLTVPDGQGGNPLIWTGAANLGGRRFEDRIGLWSDQVAGQSITFSKAKTLASLSDTYTLRLDPRWLPPGSRVTFVWLEDSMPGNQR